MEWQPIRTAPTDPTILMYPDSYGKVFLGYWNDGSGCWHRIGDLGYNPQDPTDWMPLPDPPVRNIR